MTKDFELNRRGLLLGAAAGAAMGAASLTTKAHAQAAKPATTAGKTKLHILGTQAGPSVGGSRYQTSYAVTVGDDVYVIDCGYGATQQLVRAGLKLPNIRDLFITHHHPDHNIELGTLIYFSWYAGHDKPLNIYGPPPLKEITANYLKALKPDIDIWLDDIGHKPLEPITVHEISKPGPVMQDENVKVTCALGNHPPVVPAFGYRFDTADRSIAFSGDTTPMESIAQLAKGADILVHEAIYMNAMRRRNNQADARPSGDTKGSAIAGNPDKLLQHVIKSHTSAEDAGRIAQEAGVKTLVFAHIAPTPPIVTEKQYIDAAAKHFHGEIIVASDLMVM